MSSITFIVTVATIWLFFTIVIRHIFRRSLVPPEGWLMVVGIAYALIQRLKYPWLPALHLNPDLIFVGLFPIVIFASGRSMCLPTLEKEALPILFFAIIGSLASMFLIGIPLAYVSEIPLLDALFFGAALSAPDPAAVGVILSRFGLSEKLNYIVEGESLLNDGVAVTLYAAMLAIVIKGAEFHVLDSIGEFSIVFFLSIALGGVLGGATGYFLRLWQEPRYHTQLSFSIILAYASYIVADYVFHVSGIIAVLSSAVVFMVTRPPAFCEEEDFFNDTWGYLFMLVNSFLFFALGVEVGGHDFPILILILWVVVILLISRVIVVYAGSLVLRLVSTPISFRDQNVMVLSGLRGAISVALILMMPQDYEYRIIFLCLAYVMILVPLLTQPPLLQLYLSKCKKT